MTDTPKRYCGNCRHYEPTRSPDTGRPLPSKAGKCTVIVEWPQVPICFYLRQRNWPIVWPSRYEVWPGTQAKDCCRWETKAPKRKRVGQEQKT